MQTAQRLEMQMSPQMIQSMELLQMPIMQLEQRLREEQIQNPVLEISELEGEPDEPMGAQAFDAPADDDDQPDPAADDDPDVWADHDEVDGLSRIDDLDYDWENMYDDNWSPARGMSPDDEDAYDPITNAVSRPPSLSDHLETQLMETPMEERIRTLALGMIHKLDANGWLTVPLADTVPEGEPPPEPGELERALAEVQKLEPDGIGGRNLSECLLLQLARRPESTPVAEELARFHLEDLAANRIPKIAKDLKCSVDEVKRAAEIIRTLNPRPGMGYAVEPAIAIRPELVVEGDGHDGFTVRLTSGPEPQVSEFFTALFDNSRRGQLLRERIAANPERAELFTEFAEKMRRSGLRKKFREKFNSAQWLVRAVAQRGQTLLTVAREAVRSQTDYLARRTDAPAPLFMQDVADRIGYDISTVSRAVKDKYIDTPLGIRPLREFFSRTSGQPADGKDATSNASVMLRIRELIENEDKKHPLHDNEIMDLLAKDGIVIKRRSIVNYREKLGFGSHSHRKEH